MTSLYGASFASLTAATAADLADIDVLVVDLQDVGSRYYTYVWTMGLVIRAAAAAGVAVVVLDRPNPLGGAQIEGGPVAHGFESFVGLGVGAGAPRPDHRRDGAAGRARDAVGGAALRPADRRAI